MSPSHKRRMPAWQAAQRTSAHFQTLPLDRKSSAERGLKHQVAAGNRNTKRDPAKGLRGGMIEIAAPRNFFG